ncbi:hypothetical protein G9U51_06885 [Calidifontibacter sp. DB0510]|uniref:Uncharacterized protein n=1 Tax=Metallococcus carri TaxID=1656884 RepID=A0A967B158_9MICO|nr:hypothetical protein [Metallococcus carri]NHN55505.1 hypothetical protein [Metallococcus carri]NOP38311.1 hypothetical protein [Calidifontibacter sp. DB2511S]
MRHGPDDDPSRRQFSALSLVATLVSAGLIALGTYAEDLTLTLALVVCGAALAWGWPVLTDAPSPRGSSWVLTVGVAAVGIVTMTARDQGGPRWLASALAIGLAVAFLHELLRPPPRARLVASISSAALGLIVLGGGSFYLESLVDFAGRRVVLAALAGVALGAVADAALHRSRGLAEWALPIGLVLGGAAGFGIAQATGVQWNVVLVAAMAAAAVGHGVRWLLGSLPGAVEAPAAIALGVGPVLLAGIVPYAALWVFVR